MNNRIRVLKNARFIIGASAVILVTAMLLVVFLNPFSGSGNSAIYSDGGTNPSGSDINGDYQWDELNDKDETDDGNGANASDDDYDFDNTDKTEDTGSRDEDTGYTDAESRDGGDRESGNSLQLVDEYGLFQFAVLRSASLSDSSVEMQIINQFSASIRAKYDGMIVKSDMNPSDESQKEIIIGRTSRDETKSAVADIRNNRKNNAADYLIRMDGNKLVIAATDDGALLEATNYFISNFIANKTATIAKNYSRFFKPALQKVTIADRDIADYTLVMPTDSSYIYTRHTQELCDMLRLKTGIRMPQVTDKTNETAYEIVVGNTSRSGAPVVSGVNDYAIQEGQGKLFAVGGHSYSTDTAVTQLLSIFKTQTAITAGYSKRGVYAAVSGDYQIVWKDEFDGNKLDTGIWVPRLYKRPTQPGGKYTNETAQNARVANGQLIIDGKREADGNYSTAALNTADTLEFVYGYVEMRARLPKGKGVWANFWMENRRNNAYQEIDIFEKFPGSDNVLYSNLHRWWWDKDINGENIHMHWTIPTVSNHKGYRLPGGETFNDSYHTFGCQWTPEKILFYVDGQQTYEISITDEGQELHHTPASLIIDMYLGEYGVPIDDKANTLPVEYQVDYVHLYQKSGVGLLHINRKDG